MAETPYRLQLLGKYSENFSKVDTFAQHYNIIRAYMPDMNTKYDPDDISMLWFDLDDTLWDMSGNSVICLRRMYDSENLGQYFESPEQWDEIYHEINFSLWEQYGRGAISREYLRDERFARPLRQVGVDPQTALRLAKRFDPLYLDLLGRQAGLVDGCIDLLDYLSDRGYRMGICSNGFREVQYNKLRSSGIYSYFDKIILSDDAGVNKPACGFFDYAADEAGTTGASNLLVGDNLTTDIMGALAAGWMAIWYAPGQHQTADGITTVVSLRQLRDIL